MPLDSSESDAIDVATRLRIMDAVIAQAHDAVIITSAESLDVLPGPIIRYVNPSFTRMTGYSAKEVIGKSPSILRGSLSSPEATTRIEAALQARKTTETELLYYRKDGSTFWVNLKISPVCDMKGKCTHWITIQRDISTLKSMEEAESRLQLTALRNSELTDQIRERKLVEAALSQAAFHDSLTGVRNRVYFSDSLATALKRVQGSRNYCAAILFLDLDGFKRINDSLGHRTGDLFLIEIAARLERCARVQDIVARLGGDEFTLLLDDLHSMKDALHVVERILEVVAKPFLQFGVKLQVTASVGLCEVSKTYTNAEDIMQDADTAMYRAKKQGGAQCVVFEESMHDTALTALRTTWEIRAAIENGEFELHYQPLVHTRDASIYGVEALIRWNHPVRGPLGAGEFIPLAEEIGLIADIGRWVIHQAIADMKFLKRSIRSDLLLSVNVSSKQLETDSFLAELLGILKVSSFNPRHLQLEITESIFLSDAERIGNLFRSIRDLGIQIAFDDFGTGYSSISYLERYPVDMLKIDQWFVRNPGSANAEVVQIMVRLASVFGMKVAAEGVESDAQAAAVVASGCGYAQGFLYGRPIPLAQMTKFLEDRNPPTK